jgi:hypothetical protein
MILFVIHIPQLRTKLIFKVWFGPVIEKAFDLIYVNMKIV